VLTRRPLGDVDSISRNLRDLECRFMRLKAKVGMRTPNPAKDVSTDRHAKAEVTRMSKRLARAASEVPPMTAGERR
jgi:hypothetical protein